MYTIKVTPEFGRGLYASRDLYANEIIEVAELLVLSASDTLKVNQTDLQWYTFVFDAKTGQDCLVLGNGEIFNHSDEANVNYDLVQYGDRVKMVFVSNRDIKAGDQLFIDYGRDTDKVKTEQYVNKNLVG